MLFGIKPDQKDEAQSLGYTVVDAATVVATHISQLLTNSAALLLGHEEVQNLLDMLTKSHPRLVEGLDSRYLATDGYSKSIAKPIK